MFSILPDIIIIINSYSSIDNLMFDLTNYNKAELKSSQRPEVKKTHREGVRMNTTALRREMHIKNKDIISIKSHDTEDQREEMELVTENFNSDLNLMQPLDENNKEKNILNYVERTKDNMLMRYDKITIYHFYVNNKLYVSSPIINKN